MAYRKHIGGAFVISTDDLITRPEALGILNVSLGTLIKYVQRGEITQYGGGKGSIPARYKREDVLRLKQEREARQLQPLEVA